MATPVAAGLGGTAARRPGCRCAAHGPVPGIPGRGAASLTPRDGPRVRRLDRQLTWDKASSDTGCGPGRRQAPGGEGRRPARARRLTSTRRLTGPPAVLPRVPPSRPTGPSASAAPPPMRCPLSRWIRFNSNTSRSSVTTSDTASPDRGEVVLLIHGLAGSSHTWKAVATDVVAKNARRARSRPARAR